MPQKLLAITLLLTTLPATADWTEAHCEVWHKGDHKQKASGPCTFSQRQGFIGLTLKDGQRFDLEPGNHGHYKDQHGHKLKRTVDEDGNVFKWEHRKIVLTW